MIILAWITIVASGEGLLFFCMLLLSGKDPDAVSISLMSLLMLNVILGAVLAFMWAVETVSA